MEKNLTIGSIWKILFTFALPYLLSYFLQTLYGMADLYITGRFNGVDSITAVSNGSQVMYMLTVIIVGLAMGSTVNIGRYVGAQDHQAVAHTIGNTISFFLCLSLILSVGLIALRTTIVSIMGVPVQAVQGTIQYLTICFIGIPFITAYNIISSIFRGLGDSKSPMVFIAIACAANIGLDLFFIGGLHMGPAGAALGTTLSQAGSVLIAWIAILKTDTGISLSKSNLKLKKSVLSPILRVGLPVAVQDGCIQIAFLLITMIANHRGLQDAAAVGIAEKFIGFVFIVHSSMLATVSACTSQNLGAKQYERSIQILKDTIGITFTYGILVTILVEIFKIPILSLFTSNQEVVLLASQYLSSYILDAIFAGIHFCFSGYFAAYQKSYIGFMHNMISIVCVRVPGAYLASRFYPDTLFPMGLAAPCGSVVSVIICVVFFYLLQTKGKIQMHDA